MSSSCILSKEENLQVMSYKKGISVGIINVPIQVISALAANVIIINEIGKGNLEIWYLLISTMPLFTALELSFPSLMLRNLNEKLKTKRAIRQFLVRAIFISSLFQLGVILAIQAYMGDVEASIWLFFLGAYLRTISNIIVSVPYSSGLIVHEKIYRVSYASLLPVFTLAIFVGFGELALLYLYIAWAISSACIFVFSIYALYKSESYIENNQCCDLNIPIKFKENLSLLATTIPGLFIFNLSIYYLKALANSEDIVVYGFILQLVNVYYLVNNILPSVFAPRLSKLFFSGKDISNEVVTIVDCNIFLAVLAFVSIFFLGGDILATLFLSSFNLSEIQPMLISIAIFILIESIQVTLTFFGISTGKYNYHYQSFCSALFVTIFSYFLIPLYGYLGLVYSICLAQSLTCLPFNTYFVCKHLAIPLRNIIVRMIILIAIFILLFTLYRAIKNEDLSFHLFVFFATLLPILAAMYKFVFARILRM
ncbi:hypothetical protein [Aeromonas enteropelogenes]|uniref:hypothetical protein n=1 Tax=Aeromonas enteropelogenes TaxID=29489 RepID=UPI0018D32E32|nr:hypothetical protein [Aeromonas enteropelogenes]